jgi:uncharacterized membrane protein YhaH (DUF805 family)
MFHVHGRINRATYWEAFINGLAFILVIAVALPWLLLALYTAPHPHQLLIHVLEVVLFIGVLGWIIFFFDVIKRRANDIGWYPGVLTVLTIFFPVMYIILGCVPGTPGENRYGAAPESGVHLK